MTSSTLSSHPAGTITLVTSGASPSGGCQRLSSVRNDTIVINTEMTFMQYSASCIFNWLTHYDTKLLRSGIWQFT